MYSFHQIWDCLGCNDMEMIIVMIDLKHQISCNYKQNKRAKFRILTSLARAMFFLRRFPLSCCRFLSCATLYFLVNHDALGRYLLGALAELPCLAQRFHKERYI
jgi:hypothetical protein